MQRLHFLYEQKAQLNQPELKLKSWKHLVRVFRILFDLIINSFLFKPPVIKKAFLVVVLGVECVNIVR